MAYCVEAKFLIRSLPQREYKLKLPKRLIGASYKVKAYYRNGKTKFELWYKNENSENIYTVFYKDGREILPETSPAVAASAFVNTAGHVVPKQPGPEKFSARPILGYNEKFNNKRTQAWGYDINSAYASVILDDEWIDTSKPPVDKEIDPETEVGFDLDFNIQREGYSLWVFPKMKTPEPVIRYFLNHFELKRKYGVLYKETLAAMYKILKQKEKDMLNFPIGCLQKRNPWVRAWIVGKCNERISALIDENTIIWNTDSIVSSVRRPDIEKDIGDGLGQWKLEHVGEIAIVGNNYQWNDEIPSYRGVSKKWFPENYDLLRDGMPPNRNIYDFDEENFCMIERC